MARLPSTRSAHKKETAKRRAKLEEPEENSYVDDGEPIRLLMMKGLPSLDSRRGIPRKSMSSELESLEMLKTEPSLWVRFSANDKCKALKRLYQEGPYNCFSIKDCNSEPCPLFTSINDAVEHCNNCIKPMYSTYSNGRASEFRALEKQLKSRYVKEALFASNQVECLSCPRMFSHHYGLLYHLDRCNVDIAERPWKCYKCGYTTTQDQSDLHLAYCGLTEEELRIKKELDEMFENSGAARKEMYKAINEQMSIASQNAGLNMSPGDGENNLEEIAAEKALEIILSTPSTIRSTRKRRHPVSLSAGYIPPDSSRVRISNSGALRFRFRKSEITSNPPCISDWVRYTDFVLKSGMSTELEQSKETLCRTLREIKSGAWVAVYEHPRVHFDLEKSSLPFKEIKNASNVSEDCLPPGIKRLKVFETTSVRVEEESDDFIYAGYAGGPIHTIEFAPNKLSENEEVFVTLVYPSETDLITSTWKTDDGFCQFWKLCYDSTTKRQSIKPWFVLRHDHGLLLTATWLDRKNKTDESLIGYLALGTSQGTVLIYRVSSESVNTGSANYVPVVFYEPDIVLSIENRLLNTENSLLEMSGMLEEEMSFQPPILRLAWCSQGPAQYVCASNAAGEIVTWNLLESFKEPYILKDLEWGSPAVDVCFQKGYELAVAFRERLIRVYDVTNWECVLEEATVRTAGSRVMSEPRCFPGLIAFQSEYAACGDTQATALAYISSDVQSQGYFVVPLANSHFLQTFDVSVSTINGIVASCGADGQLHVSANGKMAANLSIIDCAFSLKKTSLSLTRRRLTKVQDLKNAVIKESIISHKDICENLWLEIRADVPKEGKDVEYAAIDTRVESLNAIGTNKFSKSTVITGGQAGLLFCRPLNFEGDGDVLSRKYQRK
ncbi:unnamed protein product [Auanema sp. JU1783]|nr:unnamed protein product [Auanema sp. JU1783]